MPHEDSEPVSSRFAVSETGGRESETGGQESGNDGRTPVTILFSDIQGSTAYFEQKGDVAGLAMVERHNRLLTPCIEKNRGKLVKTIGDALMVMFADPVDAVRAAAAMQDALHEDRRECAESEQIHIRIGIHTGLALIRDDDVFGDVVNAAARVQRQAEPDQILITDSLVSPAQAAGCQIGRLGRAKLRGKDEVIDVYTVGWSPASSQRLIDRLQTSFEEQVQEMRSARAASEEEFDSARKEWREIRRKLLAEIESLETAAGEALEKARSRVSEDLQKQTQFNLEAANQARRQAEEDLRSSRERFETERVGYKAQIESLEHRLVESIERVNNPAWVSNEIREEVQTRLDQVKREALAQWDAERRRYEEDIRQLKNEIGKNPMAEARRLARERMNARAGGGEDLAAAKAQAEQERDELAARVEGLEARVKQTALEVRREVSRELRHRYDQQLEQARRVKLQLEQELSGVREELSAVRLSTSSRIRQLEEAIPEAEEAARTQTAAELQAEYEMKLDEAERARASLERRYHAESDEWRADRSRLQKQLEDLADDLDQLRRVSSRRTSDPTIEELNRLRRQMEQEFQAKVAALEGGGRLSKS